MSISAEDVEASKQAPGALERTRTVTWEDPLVAAQAVAGLSGIDFLRAIKEGRLPPPPIAMLMGFRIEDVGEGQVTFVVEPGEHHYNPIGMVHGGLAATLLDSAMGCAIQSMLPPGRGYSTLEIKVSYVRALKHDTGPVRATAKVVHMGGRVATADGRIVDAGGRLYAHATTTCLLFGDKAAKA